MCIAIICRPKKGIDKATLTRAFKSNPDGGGIAWVASGKVEIAKGFKNAADMWAAYQNVRKLYPNSWHMLHMRIATSGQTNEENCHPFKVRDTAVCHNGIVPGGNAAHSDTWELCKGLAAMGQHWHTNAGVGTLLEKLADATHSKFVVLRPNNTVRIWNEGAGYWAKGVWFSNTSADLDYGAWNTWKKKSDDARDDIPEPGMDFCDGCGQEFPESGLMFDGGYAICEKCLGGEYPL